MGRHAEPREERHLPDGFASTMMQVALRAAGDFLAETTDVNRYWAQKILFGDTDISRNANVAMRKAQYCVSLTALPEREGAAPRHRYDLHEMAVALHGWVRQLHIHHGFYISRPATAPPRQGRGSDGSDCRTEGAPAPEEPGQTHRQFEASLSKEDWLMRAILKRPTAGVLATDKLRNPLRAQMRSRGFTEHSKAIAQAAREMRDANLVSFVEPGEEEPPKKAMKPKGGWAVIRFTKKSWAAIQNDPTARAKTEQLHLSADCFDA